jgi:hypothetical protein
MSATCGINVCEKCGGYAGYGYLRTATGRLCLSCSEIRPAMPPPVHGVPDLVMPKDAIKRGWFEALAWLLGEETGPDSAYAKTLRDKLAREVPEWARDLVANTMASEVFRRYPLDTVPGYCDHCGSPTGKRERDLCRECFGIEVEDYE